MKLKSEKIVYKRYRTIVERIFEDTNGNEIIYEVRGGDSSGVSIIGITKEKEIILIKEFKPGPNKYFIDIPGGGTEKDETPVVCAQRELLEETGYRGKNAKIIGKYFLDSYSKNINYVVLIEDCEYIKQKENLKVILKPYSKYLSSINTQESVNSTALYLAKEYLKITH